MQKPANASECNQTNLKFDTFNTITPGLFMNLQSICSGDGRSSIYISHINRRLKHRQFGFRFVDSQFSIFVYNKKMV